MTTLTTKTTTRRTYWAYSPRGFANEEDIFVCENKEQAEKLQEWYDQNETYSNYFKRVSRANALRMHRATDGDNNHVEFVGYYNGDDVNELIDRAAEATTDFINRL